MFKLQKDHLLVVRWIWDVYKPFRKTILVTLLFIALMQGISMITPLVYGEILNALSKREFQLVLAFIGITVIILCLNRIIDYISDKYALRRYDFKFQEYIAHLSLDKTLSFSMGQHISSHSGIKQSVINRGRHSLASLGFMLTFTVIPDISRTIIILCALLYTNMLIGLIATVGIVAFFLSTLKINRIFKKSIQKLQNIWQANDRLSHEIITNVSLIQSYAQERKTLFEFGISTSGIRKYGSLLWIKFSKATLWRSVIPIAFQSAILLLGSLFIFRGDYELGYFVVLYAWTREIFGRLESFGRNHRQMLEMFSAIKKLYALYILKPEITCVSNPIPVKKITGKIEFRSVDFMYPSRQRLLFDGEERNNIERFSERPVKNVLQSVSFLINPGQTIALVGSSGAGKTTVVNLLLRAFDPNKGQILIDDNDLRLLNLQEYRRHVGYVEQNVSLFDDTLRRNILFGLNGQAKNFTDDQLDEIVHLAGIESFFGKLEKGYDTLIGERGVRLSGGERQRVGIARALAKNPSIMIFDEATSNLDAENEELIRTSIENASQGRTAIIIAHRLSTVRNANLIFVFDEGTIIGHGSHEELLRSCDRYKSLVQRQIVTI